MRRPLPALALGLLVPSVVLAASPASAHPALPLEPTLPTDVTYAATDNVEHLGRFPEHSGTAGGRLSEDGTVYYVTDPRGVHTYDTSDPRSPVLMDTLPLYQTASLTGAALAQEDPDTDDRVLLVDGSTDPTSTDAALHVVDVSDPRDLKVLSTVDVTDHTWTCVTAGDNGCAYAYGRTGHIVDLTAPSQPRLLETSWREETAYTGYAHDLTEFRPGLVMAAGATNVLMDTLDPAAPLLLNKMEQAGRFSSLGYHSVEWANEATDDVLVVGTEIAPRGATNLAGSDCQGEESVIETWDASVVGQRLTAYFAAGSKAARDALRGSVRSARFTLIDSFSVSGRGLFLDGAAPAHLLYCAHWMEQSPSFDDDGGLLAVSYYDRGTRFVAVDEQGFMEERGWLVAAEGYSGSAQWVTDEVVYVSDYRRGLEVVAIDPSTRATGVRSGAQDVIALGSIALTAGTGPERGSGLAPVAGAVLALLLVNVGLLRRRRRA